MFLHSSAFPLSGWLRPLSGYLPHPFRHNEIVQMYWKEACQPGTHGAAASALTDCAPVVASGEAVVPAGVTASSSRENNFTGLDWDSSSGDGDTYHASASNNQRFPTPWISSSSPPPPPPDCRILSTPPVSLPPGIKSPSASDADSSFAGYRAVDCPMRLRVEDAFSCYREDDSDRFDAGRVQLYCPRTGTTLSFPTFFCRS